MKIKKNIFFKLILHIEGFLILYFINIHPSINPYIAPIIIFILIVFNKLLTKEKKITSDKNIKKQLTGYSIGIIITSIYYLIIYLINNTELSLEGTRLVQNLIFIVYLFISVSFIEEVGKIYKTTDEKLLFIFRIAAIQGVICILMLIVPNLKLLAENIYLSSTDLFERGSYIFTTRVYGISNNYTYGMPILHGMLCGLCFYYGITNNKKSIKYLPFIFVAALLNGRTGIIVSILTIAISSLYILFKNTKNIIKLTAILVISTIIATLLIFSVKNIAPNVYKFITVAYKEISGFVTDGELKGTSGYLLRDRLFFPKDDKLIFGTGARVYGKFATTTKSSDIGYVNDIYMGGLIYAITLYIIYVKYIISAYRNNKKNAFFAVIIITALIIGNLKGEIFRCSTFMIGVFLIQTVMLQDKTISEKQEKQTKVDHE